MQAHPGGAHEEVRIHVVGAVLRGGRLDGHEGREGQGHLDALVGDRANALHRELPRDAREASDEGALGVAVHLLGPRILHQLALSQHADPVGQGEGLALVVGDVDGGDSGVTGQGGDLDAQLVASVGVEVREGLVEEHQAHLRGQGPRQRHALLLAAGELVGVALGQVGDADAFEQIGHATLLLRPGQGGVAQREGHVLAHAHVGPERVVLKDHRQVALVGAHHRRRAEDDLVADSDLTAGGLLDAREAAQQGRLARTRWSEQHGEGARLDDQRDAVERDLGPELLAEVLHFDPRRGEGVVVALTHE